MYQLIIFDWDGTLMDSTQKIANCIQASARDVGLNEPSVQQAKNIIGLGLREAMVALHGELSEQQLSQLVASYSHHFVNQDDTEQGLFAGVLDGLQTLREAGAELAVATGKSRVGLDRIVNQLQMNEHFICSRCADETRSKPHPQMLHEIVDYTGLQIQDCVMIGDTTYDLDMAGAAGMHGLGVSYGAHPVQLLEQSKPQDIVDSFEQVVAWLLDGKVVPFHS